VLTPACRLTGTTVIPPLSARQGMLVSSRADLLRLGAWIRVAAVSPHSIVHIGCRSSRHACGGHGELPGLVDLVVVRSDVGLRPSAWTALRNRLRCGRPALLQAPRAGQPMVWQPWDRTGPHLIGLAEYAATLILTGSPRALLDLGDTVTGAGNLVAVSRDIHRHGQAHLVSLAGMFRGGASSGRGQSPEFDIVGDDPLFHTGGRAAWHRSRRAVTAGAGARAGASVPRQHRAARWPVRFTP
jgi:hypothetical protein